MAAMHHILAMIFSFLFGKLVLNPVWNYGKELVQNLAQAVALFYIVVVFVAFFVATYVSPPRPECPVAS
jgi:hypothetical protein